MRRSASRLLPTTNNRILQCSVVALCIASNAMGAQSPEKPSKKVLHYERAMARALSYALKGAPTRSQMWLRRAVQNAPDKQTRQVAVHAFKQVQRSNPWSTQLSFSVAPTSNANSGSQRERVRLFDLPFEWKLQGVSKALPGVQFDGAISTRYRLRQTQRMRMELLFAAQHRTYRLGERARKIAPDTRGRDFAYSQISVGYRLQSLLGAGYAFPLQAEMSLGRSWYGYKPHADFLRVSVSQSYAPSRNVRFFVTGSLEQQISQSGGQDVLSKGLRAGVNFNLANSDALHISLSGKQSRSESSGSDFDQLGISANYSFGRPIGGVGISMGVSMHTKTHETSQYSRFGREDRTVTGNVSARFTQLEYFGFVPSLTLTARRAQSSIGLFEAESFGVQFGVQSAF